jgi:hypothetical protein
MTLSHLMDLMVAVHIRIEERFIEFFEHMHLAQITCLAPLSELY